MYVMLCYVSMYVHVSMYLVIINNKDYITVELFLHQKNIEIVFENLKSKI